VDGVRADGRTRLKRRRGGGNRSCPHRTAWDGDTQARNRARAWPLVRSGAEGETVAAIQSLLASHGYRTETDAVFGPETTAQVTSCQRDRSLADDGIVGPDTWPALVSPA
jgi:peptidoglycan hydrolase-like protein with peptidoglycan-binding domain